MKILFMGDYSGYHASLGAELRRRGHDIAIVSDGNRYMETGRDITLERRSGVWGAVRYLYDVMHLLDTLRGYDIVQLIGPHFLDLRPGKISYVLQQLRRHNGAVGLTMCSLDHFYVKAMLAGELLPYSEFMVSGKPTEYATAYSRTVEQWMQPVCRDLARQVYDEADAAFTALYEYHAVARGLIPEEKLAYVGIGVDTEALRPVAQEPVSDKKRLRIFIGAKAETAQIKGIPILQRALEKVAEHHPERYEIVCTGGLPLSRYLNEMRRADVVVDQLYSMTPATNALQAMAMEKIVIGGGEEVYYDFISEPVLRPIINADPRDPHLSDTLAAALADNAALERRARQGRELTVRHNDIRVVTDRFLKHWHNILARK